MKNKLKIIALASYSLMILMGQMIGVPFIVWLIFTCSDFGNIEQLFAVLGLTGFILNFTKYGKGRIIKILSFLLMLTPVIKRLTTIPIEKFLYPTFLVPFFVFLVTYFTFILKSGES